VRIVEYQEDNQKIFEHLKKEKDGGLFKACISFMISSNEGYVTLWPCQLLSKVCSGKRRIMETQIFHQAKI
jgi:hypothetical protein